MEANNKKKSKKKAATAWKIARPVVVVALSIAIAVLGFLAAGYFVVNSYLSPVDSSDAMPVEFVIEDGWGASTIAKHLFEACGEDNPGLIKNKAVFKIYVDFMGKSKELRAGKYYLSKNMDIPTIIDVLCRGGLDTSTIRVTIPEGTTVEGIFEILTQAGMSLEEEQFFELCKTGERFTSYEFINNVYIAAEEDRRYALEGYLFPDTYEFFVDSSSENVIVKMLDRFEDVCYNSESGYATRAEELGMSMDEVTALASVIEREAVLEEDFYMVSAVFHNRLAQDMRLQSDAPLAYIFRTEKVLFYTDEQLQSDSPYNTYTHDGVPIGAICNPGKLALDAALNPNADYVKGGYLYFCLTDRETNKLVYAKTYEEHMNNVAKYKQYWGS